ncbi:hypothetical protein HHL23_21780 [Chryseobacterium sp. RP-3-3]|uniref:Uncharacterized protein n=1 Tax=Chryseobacterium antibioticum TaxID=2728847 RepID=A0A7Y0ARX5_9FLAO|nr:hypothetical protein [Chryseobacterium antibioticum]NML72393.1 hypothetical protein [Chryseobacterium antibioticum]
MLLLLCSFCITNAQLYIGACGSLHIKDSILFQTERKNSPVPLYVEGNTKVYNLEQISNVKVAVLSSPTLKKSSQNPFAKNRKKPKNRKTEKKALKLISKPEVYISENIRCLLYVKIRFFQNNLSKPDYSKGLFC